MKFFSMRRAAPHWQMGLEGLLLMLAAFPFIFSIASTEHSVASWRIFVAAVSGLMFLISAWHLTRNPALSRGFAAAATTGSLLTALPFMKTDPSVALFGAVLFILAIYNLVSLNLVNRMSRSEDLNEKGLQRARWAGISLCAMSIAYFLLVSKPTVISELSLFTAAMIAQLLAVFWSVYQQSNFHKAACIIFNSLTWLLMYLSWQQGNVWIGALTAAVVVVLELPSSSSEDDASASWLDMFFHHSARVTIVTFLLLCLSGTVLLYLPASSSGSHIALIDAAFTSVSAVCVTGLIVLDTPNDFSLFGQAMILMLIQLGGIGIMTVTTVAFYAMGRRLSLSHERALNSAYNTDHSNLGILLAQIVRFTLICEALGACALFYCFASYDMPLSQAAWRAVFTSISAFCNAGFALQSDSLIPFNGFPAVLHIVATLIVAGGLAPAVTLAIPSWLRGEKVSLACRIALITTLVLLGVGTVVFLIFEWNGALAGLSLIDRIHNAWFQSVTLRTAGFNSVPIENVAGPTLIMMIVMMFIGGCPGGTAGGVKTVTFGVLAITFWTCVSGYDEITVQDLRIRQETVYKAVTIFVAGIVLLLLTVFMLEVTQLIDSRNIIFEAASALGTVGLSLGATSLLDGVGKVIIMISMFAGRVGPVTFFSLLSRERSANASNCLNADINLT